MVQMDVSYSRRLDYQYMIIDAGEDIVTDYRLPMLIHNRIEGFLPVHIQQMNGKSTLNYEITSLEALPSFLDARKITYDEMVSLLLQFCSAVSEAGRYLLDGEGILLEPQYIFVSKSIERVRFCYYPYQHMPLYQSVNVLCCFLIDHIDYDDRKSLELAYGLFQESLKENLSIHVIVGCIKNRLEEKTNDMGEPIWNENSDSSEESEYETEVKSEIRSKENRLREEKLKEKAEAKERSEPETKTQPKVELKTEKELKISRSQPKIQEKYLKTSKKGSQTSQRIKRREIAWSIVCTLLVMAILGYALFIAGRRLAQLEIIGENMLIIASILIAIAAVIAGTVAYRILKRQIQ